MLQNILIGANEKIIPMGGNMLNRCFKCGRFVGLKAERYGQALDRLGLLKSLHWHQKSLDDLICGDRKHDTELCELDRALQDIPTQAVA